MKNNYSLSNIKKIKWGILEENNPISLYPIMYPGWSYIIEKSKKILGKPQKSIICLHQGKQGLIFVDHKEWNELGEFILKKYLSNIKFADKINNEILKLSDELVNFTTKQIFNANLKSKSDQELFKLYKEYEIRHGELYVRSIVPVYLELYKPHLTNYLVGYLNKLITKQKYQQTAKECFAILTNIDKPSKVQLEEISLFKIAQVINNDIDAKNLFNNNLNKLSKEWKALSPNLAKQLSRHINSFKYLGYNFEGPAFDDLYFLSRLRNLIKTKQNISKLLDSVKKEKNISANQIKHLNKELKIDNKHLKLFQVARDIIYSKDYRKMSLVEAYYRIEPLLTELADRCDLSLGEIRNCLLSEIPEILKTKKPPKDLYRRMKGCLFVITNQDLPGRVYVDDTYIKMKEYLKNKEDYSQVSYFHGQTASPGQARGTVRIINYAKDLIKMKPGDILVSQMTNPDLVPAMKIAAAIITDLGGITCHAAIVSRELKKPCVIGTKIATQALKDGDKVFVDANTGEVRKI